MKTYRVLASYVTYCYLDVEAENLDEAKEIAYNSDGSDFKQNAYDSWNIDDVLELKKEVV